MSHRIRKFTVAEPYTVRDLTEQANRGTVRLQPFPGGLEPGIQASTLG